MGNAVLIAVMAATMLVLIGGVVLMAVGGKMNAKYNNKLMVMRVALQAAALAVLALIFFLKN